MKRFVSLFIIGIFLCGCSSELNTFKQCSKGICFTAEEIPSSADIALYQRLPTTSGGYVSLLSARILTPPSNFAIIAGSIKGTAEELLTFESLGSSIYRLRTRSLDSEGQWGNPNCDFLEDQSFRANEVAFLNGDLYFMQPSSSTGSLVQYDMVNCRLLQSTAYPVSFNIYSSRFAVSENVWYHKMDSYLDIFDRETRIKIASYNKLTRGGKSVTWSFSSIVGTANYLWVYKEGSVWRMDSRTFSTDWFELPLGQYPCLSHFSLMWTDDEVLNIMCDEDTGVRQIFKFDVRTF